jgi:DASS family divalent anion:Na+ symporter
MGQMKFQEWVTLGVFLLMLFLWIFGGMYIIAFDDFFTLKDVKLLRSESTTTAMIGVSILIITGVLSWKDVVEEEGAWNTLFWFATLIMMAGFLSSLGLIGWVSEIIEASVRDIGWVYAYVTLIVGYFYSHYLFASSTAHASSMYAAFAVVGITAGVSPLPMTLSLAFASSLSACMTHYGMATGPIFYGAGYVDLVSWWKLGAMISVVHLIVWFGLGSLWWQVIGLW